MTQQRKPSAGALRAANALAGLATNTRANIHSVALIIDREMAQTGVAELLEAAKQVLADLSDEQVPDADTVEMLEQAITKAEQ